VLRAPALPPAGLTDIQRAARFFYLQQHAFGGRVDGQVNIDEYPAFPGLGAGHFAGLGFAQQGDGVDVEKGRGFPQVEGLHYAAPILGMLLRNPARMRDQPMRSFHSTPSATTR